MNVTITIERNEKQVSIYSLEPCIIVIRDADASDEQMLDLYRDSLTALRQSFSTAV